MFDEAEMQAAIKLLEALPAKEKLKLAVGLYADGIYAFTRECGVDAARAEIDDLIETLRGAAADLPSVLAHRIAE